MWRVEKEESKGDDDAKERRVTFGLDLLCARGYRDDGITCYILI